MAMAKKKVVKKDAVAGVVEVKNKLLSERLPASLDNYYLPKWRDRFAARINNGSMLFLSGPAGSGKSELVRVLADAAGKELIRINFVSGIGESQLVGKYIVKNGETVFNYGLVPLAMKNGWWLLLDEIDYAEPEHLAILQPVLEGGSLVMIQNEGEKITPHPDFRIIATGNTKGRGDVSQSYVGTNFLNASFMDRFTVFEMDYTEKEVDIIENETGDKTLAEKLVQVFQLFRKSAEDGQINNAVFSTRRIVQVCKALRIGDSLKEAFEYEIFSRYDKEESKLLVELVRDVFAKEHYLSKKWTLGMDHPNTLQADGNFVVDTSAPKTDQPFAVTGSGSIF
jgi:cobaltochelatase CobS